MKISARGLALIKLQEGYLKPQKDGSCKAYRCPAGVWTCGWGCTDGVEINTHWTPAEAEEALRVEMGRHEGNVMRLVTVAMTQGQFDALVSLCYNIGVGNLKRSSLLRHLNSGDYARAASHFADYKYAKVRGDTARHYKVKDGTSVALAGLVSRRAAETELFLQSAPVDMMPQKVDPPTSKMTSVDVVAKVVPATGVVATGGTALMSPPDLSALSAWQAAAEQGKGMALWCASNWPWAAAAAGAYVILAHGLPYWQARRA